MKKDYKVTATTLKPFVFKKEDLEKATNPLIYECAFLRLRHPGTEFVDPREFLKKITGD